MKNFIMSNPRDILTRYDIKPQKRLGQSFLVEQNSIAKIAQIANIARNDIVVEVGAGIGVLTESLAQQADRVIALELDHQLIAVLQDRLSAYHNVDIKHVNVLRFDFRQITKSANQRIAVVGNIPYNISSPLLFHLLSFRDVIHSFVLMMQKELIDRLIAVPGNKQYGVPSVILQMFAAVERVMNIPATFFYPRPKVESSVMKGVFLDQPVMKLNNEEFFVRLVRDSFAQRRKMLLNNLKKSKWMDGLDESLLHETLTRCGIDPQRRGETLSVEEFGELSNRLAEKVAK